MTNWSTCDTLSLFAFFGKLVLQISFTKK